MMTVITGPETVNVRQAKRVFPLGRRSRIGGTLTRDQLLIQDISHFRHTNEQNANIRHWRSRRWLESALYTSISLQQALAQQKRT